MKPLNSRGLTMIEMIAVSTIIVILATVAVPVIATMQRKHKEIELRQALREVRSAIDDYRRIIGDNPALQNNPHIRPECEGYPCELEDLVNGIDTGQVKELKLKFLRRIPVDPMTGKREWGMRSSKQDPDASAWDHLHVFDIYSLSEGMDQDGTSYKAW